MSRQPLHVWVSSVIPASAFAALWAFAFAHAILKAIEKLLTPRRNIRHADFMMLLRLYFIVLASLLVVDRLSGLPLFQNPFISTRVE